MARCFHCGEHTNDLRHSKARLTKDHIYPRAIIPRGATAEWRHMNIVDSCWSCNNYKGGLHPLDWLLIMKDDHRAKVLAERLVKLGEDMEAVFDVMRRRKKRT